METPKSRAARFVATEALGVVVSHTIRFRRPETPYSLSKMTVSTRGEALSQVQRLKTLGYAIIEITPPLVDEPPVAP